MAGPASARVHPRTPRARQDSSQSLRAMLASRRAGTPADAARSRPVLPVIPHPSGGDPRPSAGHGPDEGGAGDVDVTLHPWTLAFRDAQIEREYRTKLGEEAPGILKMYRLWYLLTFLVPLAAVVIGPWFFAHLVIVTAVLVMATMDVLAQFERTRALVETNIWVSRMAPLAMAAWFLAVMIEVFLSDPRDDPVELRSAWMVAYGLYVLVLLVSFDNVLLFPLFAAVSSSVALCSISLSILADSETLIPKAGVALILIVALFSARRRERTSRAIFLLLRQLRKENVKLGTLSIDHTTDILSIFSQRRHKGTEGKAWMIPADQLEMGELLGDGSYGDVHLARWRGTDVAVKSLRGNRTQDAHLRDFLGEVSLLSELRHPNIVLFMGVSLDGGQALLVTEYMNGGSLHETVHREGVAMPARAKLSAMAQAASGLAYLHSLSPPVLHGDFKTGNILVDDRWNVKIADFGMSFVYEGLGTEAEDAGHRGKGTLIYAAPEVLRGEALSVAADVYALGIVMWEVSEEEVPYGDLFRQCGPAAVSVMVTESDTRPEVVQMQLGGAYRDLMESCWAKRADTRPTAGRAHELLQAWYMEQRGASDSNSHSKWESDTQVTPSSATAGRSGGPMALAVVEFVNGAELWEYNPRLTRRALRDTVLPGLRLSVESHRGLVRRMGPDGAQVGFQRARRALEWAMDAQATLREARALGGALEVRIGLHVGDLDDDETRRSFARRSTTGQLDAPEADSVALGHTRRLAALARGGEVIVSEAFVDATEHAEDFDLHLDDGWRTQLVCDASLGSARILHPVGLGDGDGDGDFEAFGVRAAEAAAEMDWAVQPTDVVAAEGRGVDLLVTTTARRALFMGAAVSVKRISGLRSEEQGLLFHEHCTVLHKARHRHIVPLVGGWAAGHSGVVLHQWMERSLAEYLLTEARGTIEAAGKYLIGGIADGLAYLHSLEIVHRAVSASNVLIDDEGTVKVADVQPGVVSAAVATRTAIEAVAVRAPEVLGGGRPRAKSDVFGLALVAFEVLVGDKPFGKVDGRVLAAVSKGLRPTVPSRVGAAKAALLEGCWDGDAERRWSAEQAREAARAW